MDELSQRKMGQTIALVIAASGLATIFAPWIVMQLGLAPRYEFLIYLLALAGMAWSLLVTVKLWLTRQRSDKG